MNEAVSAKITILIYKIVFCVTVNTYVPIFRGLDARGGRKLRTDTHTCSTTTVTIIIRIIRSAEAHAYNIYVCKTAQREAHLLIWNNNKARCFTCTQTCNGEYNETLHAE